MMVSATASKIANTNKVGTSSSDNSEIGNDTIQDSSQNNTETSDQEQETRTSLRETQDETTKNVSRVVTPEKVEGEQDYVDEILEDNTGSRIPSTIRDRNAPMAEDTPKGEEETVQELQNPNVTYLSRKRNINSATDVTNNGNDDDELLAPKDRIEAIMKKQDPVLSSSSTKPEIIKRNTEPDSKGMVDSTIRSENNAEVYISEANKVLEGQGRAYVAYTIQYQGRSVRRRYSDFESLRSILVKLFPARFIPPIPEKQTIKSMGRSIASGLNLNLGNHLSYQSLVPTVGSDDVGDLSASIIDESISSSDEQMIRYRIRMLTQFLRKVLRNEHIRQTNIISEFLDPGNVSWGNFVAGSGVLASLPENILRCNPVDPTQIDSTYALLPLPSSTQNLVQDHKTGPDSKDTSSATRNDAFEPIEQNFLRYKRILDSNVYNSTKGIVGHLSSLSSTMKEVAATFANSASENNHDPEIAENFAHYSDTYDESSQLLEVLSAQLYYKVNEPLKGDVATANVANKLLAFRRTKYIQREMIRQSIRSNKANLKRLEEHIEKYKHVDKIIDQEVAQSNKINLTRPEYNPEGYSGKFLKGLSRFATMVKESMAPSEVDPRVVAENVRGHIQQLEKMLEVTNRDMDMLSDIILNEELLKIREERKEELLKMLRCYAHCMKLYAEKNMEVWKEIKWHQDGK